MIKNFPKFFLDTGPYSIMRLLAFILVVTGCVLAIVLSIMDLFLTKGANLLAISALVGSLIALGLGGKVLQKKDEISVESKTPSTE